MSHSRAPILVITGMHRSGTSAITATFATAGLEVGPRLMPAARGNPRGHFEDLDFVSLHERMLRANTLGSEGFATTDDIPVPATLANAARALVRKRRRRELPWGWKDPRTTLFLDWWSRMLPDARFVLLVRSPAEVIDSLFRRGDEAFTLNPAFAIDVWMAYNRRILDFCRAFPDRCFVASSEAAVADPVRLVNAVRDRWQIPLTEPANVVEPALFRGLVSQACRAVVAHLRPEALELHAALQAAAGMQPPPKSQFSGYDQGSLALAEWCRAAGLEGRLAEAHTRTDTLAVACEHSQAELAAARQRAETMARELAAARQEIERLARLARSGSLFVIPKKPFIARIARETRRLLRRAGGRRFAHSESQSETPAACLPVRAQPSAPEQIRQRRAA
jgi:hypothetical protein